MRVPSSVPYLSFHFLKSVGRCWRRGWRSFAASYTTNWIKNEYWRVFAVICLCFENVCCHLPNLWKDLLSFAESIKGFSMICIIYEGICCHLPNLWRDLLSFAEFMNGFAIICRFVEGICCHLLSFANFWKGFAVICRFFTKYGCASSFSYRVKKTRVPCSRKFLIQS